MLFDFNKLLPNKTNNKALGILSILIIIVGILMLLSSLRFYEEANSYVVNNFIDNQLVSLSPSLTVF